MVAPRSKLRKRFPWALALSGGALALAVWVVHEVDQRNVFLAGETALERFYARGKDRVNDPATEDMLADPLILNAERVAPLVVDRLSDPNMPRRSYAIAFLGDVRYVPATPPLTAIVADARETASTRCIALDALLRIDETLGKSLAVQALEDRELEPCATGRLAHGVSRPRRTYWMAFWGGCGPGMLRSIASTLGIQGVECVVE